MNDLTARQREVLDFITLFIAQHSYSPTHQDIARFFNFKSANAAQDLIKILKRKGYVDYKPHQARTITIVERN